MSIISTRFAGTRSVLVELSDLDSVLALGALLEASPLPGQVDVLAAASTLFIKTDGWASAQKISAAVLALELGSAPADAGSLVEVPVHYDGEDLAEVARLTGLSVEGVVNAHSQQTWRAAFGGFAPGFAYLLGENQVLNVPRRDTPRKVVPSGAVALAGDYSAVYPRQSPGGWQLIGHTDAVLWDLERPNPALIRPQDRVRFIPSRTSLQVAPAQAAAQAPAAPAAAHGTLLVVDPGLQSLIQDLGRPGFGNLGVSAAGSADTGAASQANRLVGNASSSALIENLMGSLTLQAAGDQVLAVSGAEAEIVIVPVEDDEFHEERLVPMNTPFALLDGEIAHPHPAGAGPAQLRRGARRHRRGPGAGLAFHRLDVRHRPGPAHPRIGAARRRRPRRARGRQPGALHASGSRRGRRVHAAHQRRTARRLVRRRPGWPGSPARSGRSRPNPTASASAWPWARAPPRWSGSVPANSPARASPWARCRSPRRACRCSSSPTTPSPAATRSSPASSPRTSAPPPSSRPGPAIRFALIDPHAHHVSHFAARATGSRTH